MDIASSIGPGCIDCKGPVSRRRVRCRPCYNRAPKTNGITDEVRRKMSASHRGKPLSEEHKRRAAEGLRGKPHPERSGERHWNWRGGITPTNIAIRMSLPYANWRTAVFERDGYACVIGGKAHGNKLQADHIKPFSTHPELRFDINNGRTLCVACHRATPTFAGRVFTIQAV